MTDDKSNLPLAADLQVMIATTQNLTAEMVLAKLIQRGLGIEQVVDVFTGEHEEPDWAAYVGGATFNDELEMAGSAGYVSPGADDGAWVLTWTWVSDADADIERCSECNANLAVDSGEGYGSLCGSCADKAMADDGEDDPEVAAANEQAFIATDEVLNSRAVACDDCAWQGTDSQLKPIQHLEERIDAGGVVPAGQCPECGALAYLVAS